jgi:hypothetical protein
VNALNLKKKEGNCMPKYPGVAEAVKWMNDYYKAVDAHLRKDSMQREEEGMATGHLVPVRHEVHVVLENLDTIAKKLEINFENEIDNKTKENSGMRQLIQNFREDGKHVAHSINMFDVAMKTHEELGISTRPLNYLSKESKVAPDFFVGFSLISEQRSAGYDSGTSIKEKDLGKFWMQDSLKTKPTKTLVK